jgi:hypothetical protein
MAREKAKRVGYPQKSVFLLVLTIGIALIGIVVIMFLINGIITKTQLARNVENFGFASHKSQITNNLQETPPHTQDPQHYFDEKTRILTSPELLGNDQSEWRAFKFQLKIPENWEVYKTLYEENKTGYMLSITKDEVYFVEINYGYAYGPSTCVFPGDKEPEGGYEPVDQFETLNTGIGILRLITKSTINNESEIKIYRVCELNKYNQWSTATRLDQINVVVKGEESLTSSAEAKSIIKSLKIIKI